MISALMTLFISSVALMILTNGLQVLSHCQSEPWTLQNGIDIAILQQRLVYASDLNFSSDALHFKRDGQTWELKLIDDHLVLTPGAQYFASNIDAIHFQMDGSLVELVMMQDDHERTIALAYVD